MNEQNAIELYRRYRPTKLSEVIGQSEAVDALSAMGKSGKIPGFIMFTGPSGTGKTTLARILRHKLKVSDLSFIEVNAAKDRGIDLVRRIEQTQSFPPLEGKYKMWLCDEVHAFTSEAQGAFLKLLEDIPEYIKYIFCTTDPQKLRQTIRTRATVINLNSVGQSDLEHLVRRVAEQENQSITDEVVDRIADLANGSPRKALVLLGQVIGIEPDNQLDVLNRSDPERDAIEIARGLLSGNVSWKNMAKMLKSIQGLDEQAEKVRWLVLSYMKSVALGGSGKSGDAVRIIEEFEENFYDSKAAGLVRACYNCIRNG